MASSVSLYKQMLISCTLPGIQRVSSFGWRGNKWRIQFTEAIIWIRQMVTQRQFQNYYFCYWFAGSLLSHTTVYFICSLWKETSKKITSFCQQQLLWTWRTPNPTSYSPHCARNQHAPPIFSRAYLGDCSLSWGSRHCPQEAFWVIENFQHLIVLTSVVAASWVDVPFLSSRGAGAICHFLIFYLTKGSVYTNGPQKLLNSP